MPRVAIDLITVEKPVRLDFTDEKTELFVEAIEKIGVINPIGVREFKVGNTVQYELVCGRRRLAVAKYLKWTHVEVKIGNWTHEEAEFIRCAENLHRKHLNAAQEARQTQVLLAEYQRLWGKTTPAKAHSEDIAAKSTRSEGGVQRKGTFLPGSQSPQIPTMGICGDTPAKQEETPNPSRPKLPTPAKLLASATDKSKSEAYRDIAVANAFTKDQIQSLEHTDATQQDLENIAKIEDPKKRNTVINHVCLGKDVNTAIKDVAPQVKLAGDDGMSDSQWLVEYCGEFARKLQDPRPYNRDATLYKQSRKLLAKLKDGVKDHVANARQGSFSGPFTLTMNRLITLCHPCEWLLCGTCKGQNMDQPKCPDCKGCGYKTKHDYQQAPQAKAKPAMATAENSI